MRRIRGTSAAIPRRGSCGPAGHGDPGALPAAAIAAHPVARCAGIGRAGGHHRRAIQPGRCDPGFRLPRDSHATDGAAWRAFGRRAGRPAARMQFCGDRAGQAGRAGTELQFRRRFDVRVFGQRRNGRTRRGDQQGIFQESGQSVHRAAFDIHSGRIVLSRGSAFAARRPVGRGLHLAGWRQELLPGARARLGKADADQGPGVRRRPDAGPRISGIRGAAYLYEYAGFPGGGSGFRGARADQRKAGGQACAGRVGHQTDAGRHPRH